MKILNKTILLLLQNSLIKNSNISKIIQFKFSKYWLFYSLLYAIYKTLFLLKQEKKIK